MQPENIVTRQDVEQRGSLTCLFVDDMYLCAAKDATYILEKIDADYYIVKYIHARCKRLHAR
jgi:hypothetical protein